MTIQESNDRIIELLLSGKSVKEIAADMFMRQRTVELRLQKMRQKYSCSTTVQLIYKKMTENRTV